MISSISLHNYKNYRETTVQFHKGVNFLVGSNGMGKTNLLDAIYYLGMAKGHSTPQDRDTILFGQDFFRLTGEVSVRDALHQIVVKVKPGELKEISVDGRIMEKLSAYVGYLPVVMLAPEDIVLIQGGSVARRRFLDVVLCQADRNYLEQLQRYNKVLSQRNALLRSHGPRSDKSLLLTYSDAMSDAAQGIYAQRVALIDALLPDTLHYYALLSKDRELPDLRYSSHLKEQSISELARTSLESDLQNGRTTRGVHRDDIEIELDGKSVKRFGSQGQIKSLLIALHLAQLTFLRKTLGITPILLLDDIFDRLDETRAQQLISLLTPDHVGQVFISDASPARVKNLMALARMGSHVFHIDAGEVSEVGSVSD